MGDIWWDSVWPQRFVQIATHRACVRVVVRLFGLFSGSSVDCNVAALAYIQVGLGLSRFRFFDLVNSR